MSEFASVPDPFANQRTAHEQGRSSVEGSLPTFEKSKGKRRRPSHQRKHSATAKRDAGGKLAKKYKGHTRDSDRTEANMQLMGMSITGGAPNHADRTCEYVSPKVEFKLASHTHST